MLSVELASQAWRTFDASGGLFGLDGVRHVLLFDVGRAALHAEEVRLEQHLGVGHALAGLDARVTVLVVPLALLGSRQYLISLGGFFELLFNHLTFFVFLCGIFGFHNLCDFPSVR